MIGSVGGGVFLFYLFLLHARREVCSISWALAGVNACHIIQAMVTRESYFHSTPFVIHTLIWCRFLVCFIRFRGMCGAKGGVTMGKEGYGCGLVPTAVLTVPYKYQ